MRVSDGNLAPKGYQKIATPAAATALTVPPGARYALIKTEGQAVRWRDDGVNPSTTDGMLIDVGDEFMFTGKLATFRVIEATAGATVHISYYA